MNKSNTLTVLVCITVVLFVELGYFLVLNGDLHDIDCCGDYIIIT